MAAGVYGGERLGTIEMGMHADIQPLTSGQVWHSALKSRPVRLATFIYSINDAEQTIAIDHKRHDARDAWVPEDEPDAE